MLLISVFYLRCWTNQRPTFTYFFTNF